MLQAHQNDEIVQQCQNRWSQGRQKQIQKKWDTWGLTTKYIEKDEIVTECQVT